MPTTLTGLVLLVVLLLPGSVYLGAIERNNPKLERSPLGEIATLAGASVVADALALLIFAGFRSALPNHTPDVGRLVREGGDYLRAEYAYISRWAGLVLILAALIAWVGAWLHDNWPPRPLRRRRKKARRVRSTYRSSWWMAFETNRDIENESVYVQCLLADDWYIEGRLWAYNESMTESGDRDLLLASPIRYRAPGADDACEYEAESACISASRIIAMFVSHETKSSNDPRPASPGLEGEALGASEADRQPRAVRP